MKALLPCHDMRLHVEHLLLPQPYCGPQVFLDVVESVNLLVNSNGTVVRSEVVGALKMRTYLSGMPECKLGLNDKVRVFSSSKQ